MTQAVVDAIRLIKDVVLQGWAATIRLISLACFLTACAICLLVIR